jgi:ABC-type antimicrobial peptide transport system permease subunit
MVMKQLGKLTVIGAVIGLIGSVALGKGAQSLLYGVTGIDPWVMVLAAVLLGVVSILAGLIPALKAARIPPMQALRYE